MKIQQNKDELINHLQEQVRFLSISARSFDNGFEGEAKRLGLVIRVLLHDTKYSTSLLTSLGLKEKLWYYSLIESIDEERTVVFVGLGMMPTEKGLKYIPKLDTPNKKLNFDEWWNQVVILQKVESVRFKRGEIILRIANEDGGAHVDPALDADYSRLSRDNAFGWQFSSERGVVENGPELAIVRQCAHEINLSLSEQLEDIIAL